MTTKPAVLVKRDRSASPLRTFSFSKVTGTVFPDFSFQAVMALIDEDPTARGALSAYIDSFMEGDYAILTKDELEYDPVFERKLDDTFRFRHEVIRKFAIMGKMYKNVFIELVRAPSSKEVVSLNVVDTNGIDTITKPNGDIEHFRSKFPDPLTGQFPTWLPTEMVWYKLEDRGLGWATVDFKSLYNNLLAKKYVTQYVAWLWKTGQYRILYNFTNASDPDIQTFLAYAQRNADNPDAPMIAKGELEAKVVRDMQETGSILELLKYYDSQTLVAMRIPPIDAGLPDGSGRSNADAQSGSLNAHILSMKKAFEDVTNAQLFPLMQKGNSVIRFGPNDRFEEKQIIENLVALRSVQVHEDVIREYLRDRGMFFKGAKLFEEPVVAPVASGGPQSNAPPSRQKSGDLQKQGTGQAASTRQDQVTTK